MIGKIISHYRILKKLSGGGMGEVYEAGDLSLPRHLAIKFLPDDLLDSRNALETMHDDPRWPALLKKMKFPADKTRIREAGIRKMILQYTYLKEQ